jgi:hypothetical protein
MAPFDDAALRGRARRRYELGRLWHAVRTARPIALALVLAAVVAGTAHSVALAVVAFGAIVLGGCRGQTFGQAVRIGSVAGVVPLLMPVLVNAIGHRCSGCAPTEPMPLCLAACAVGGALAGLWSAARGAALGGRDWAVAFGVAALVGAAGCVVAGGFGLAGLAAGMIVGGVPSLVMRARGASPG